MFKITNIISNLLNLKNHQTAIYDLIKLIVFILIVAHFCGCSFYMLSLTNNEYNWIKRLKNSTDI